MKRKPAYFVTVTKLGETHQIILFTLAAARREVKAQKRLHPGACVTLEKDAT
jgi:hypothetical protein